MEQGDGNSPSNSQQTVSDDDEIDYSTKPEFYDPELDEKDEKWIRKNRHGRDSDAVLCCPACFTTLCLECQRHEKYLTQYRAIFVTNCKIEDKPVMTQSSSKSRKRNTRDREFGGSHAISSSTEKLKQVCCTVCSTEVGVFDEDEIYHFFNVLPSEC
ncbi:unnamed protein product [Vicia faba]|uniref:E2F-associated phosphoprotein n=1 Tax=Vicia faba TaxID=3906 RepID=A0AAV0ZVU5_VICFA|nr:unnamed protein product [Vicia faba]